MTKILNKNLNRIYSENSFSVEHLSLQLEKQCQQIAFAYLFGSAQDGVIQPNSDIDIGVYLFDIADNTRTVLEINRILEEMNISVECDIIFLNNSDSILSFEVIRGKRLFVRDEALDIYSGYYSLVCREYESDSYWMKKQLEYRNYEVQWDN